MLSMVRISARVFYAQEDIFTFMWNAAILIDGSHWISVRGNLINGVKFIKGSLW